MTKTFKEDADWLKTVLPDHYTCEPIKNGVLCYSSTGIDDRDKEHWFYIVKAIKQKLGARFQEIFHITYSNHVKFTVYIKPS